MACAGSLPADGFPVTGIVRHAEIEGGVFLIEVADTIRYQPLDLPVAFRQDGLRVRATLRLVDRLTTAQAGTVVEVLTIVRDTAS